MAESVFATVLLLPFAVACLCFLVSLVFMTRMLRHLRAHRRWSAAALGPFALLSEALYTPTGLGLLRQFKRWFRRFALWLVFWGGGMLLLVVVMRVLSGVQ